MKYLKMNGKLYEYYEDTFTGTIHVNERNKHEEPKESSGNTIFWSTVVVGLMYYAAYIFELL